MIPLWINPSTSQKKVVSVQTDRIIPVPERNWERDWDVINDDHHRWTERRPTAFDTLGYTKND